MLRWKSAKRINIIKAFKVKLVRSYQGDSPKALATQKGRHFREGWAAFCQPSLQTELSVSALARNTRLTWNGDDSAMALLSYTVKKRGAGSLWLPTQRALRADGRVNVVFRIVK
jgi:hypothetical protein